jgi:hypothetical protein
MTPVLDISGYRIFSQGELGHAHAMAHRMLDSGHLARGRRELGAWLEGREGEGSDWVHVQWHMLVFELADGAWGEAHARFLAHVLPGVRAGEAATDGPAGLWRLALTAAGPVDLPWETVQRVAKRRLGDLDGLDHWLDTYVVRNAVDRVLAVLGWALRCFADGDWTGAVHAFDHALPELSSLGGSRAQNELFHDLCAAARLRVSANDLHLPTRVVEAVGAA